MDTIHVYHLSRDNLGKTITFKPRVPDFGLDIKDFKENNTIPRICVAPTIAGCLFAIGCIPDKINDEVIYHVYETDVNTKYVYQPTIYDTLDSYYTGELWILRKTTFTKTKILECRKQFDLPNYYYSRYSIHPLNEDSVKNRIIAPLIYGDNEYNFSFIDIDIFRRDEALNYDLNIKEK